MKKEKIKTTELEEREKPVQSITGKVTRQQGFEAGGKYFKVVLIKQHWWDGGTLLVFASKKEFQFIPMTEEVTITYQEKSAFVYKLIGFQMCRRGGNLSSIHH